MRDATNKADSVLASLPLPSTFCLLPTAYCLLLSAFCLLPSAFCLLIAEESV